MVARRISAADLVVMGPPSVVEAISKAAQRLARRRRCWAAHMVYSCEKWQSWRMEVHCKERNSRPASCVPDLEASHIMNCVNKLVTELFWPLPKDEDASDALLDEIALVHTLRRHCFVDINFVLGDCNSVRGAVDSDLDSWLVVKDEDSLETFTDEVAIADALRRPCFDDINFVPQDHTSVRIGAVNRDSNSPQMNDCQIGSSDDGSSDILGYLLEEGTLIRLSAIERLIKGDFVLGVILQSDALRSCYELKILWTRCH